VVPDMTEWWCWPL